MKSAERVRDLGEVFTPNVTVQAMLDLLPDNIWEVHPSPTFLEPACGDGNFLVAILNRKLDRIASDHSKAKLAAGDTTEAAQFHALEALASIYAVDISIDNVVGGMPGHEIGARTRLLNQFTDWNFKTLDRQFTQRSLVLRAAEWIVAHNIIVGNMLPFDADGRETGRDQIPLIEYSFIPKDQTVVLKRTTLGDVFAVEQANSATVLSLFGPAESTFLWRGKAVNLSGADRVEAPKIHGQARNGTVRRS
ncbi:MAG: hypothetical protein M0T78_04640 [Actinomycetota bacterium]|nr:hypothetical protein [Actinomycetota bacterium]